MCPNLIFKLVFRQLSGFQKYFLWNIKSGKKQLVRKMEQNLVFFSGEWSNLYMEWAAPATHPQEPGVLPESLRWWGTLGHYGRYCGCLMPRETQSCRISEFMEAMLKHQEQNILISSPPPTSPHAAPSTSTPKLTTATTTTTTNSKFYVDIQHEV